jgi:hypothetical protein
MLRISLKLEQSFDKIHGSTDVDISAEIDW